MLPTQRQFAAHLLALSALLIVACGRDATAPAPPDFSGAIEITVSTISSTADYDTTNYEVSIDNGPRQPVDASGRIRVGGLQNIEHRLQLYGWSPNCRTAFDDVLRVRVIPQQTTLVDFLVTCAEPQPSPWDY